MLGTGARFRLGQWEAIEALVLDRRRVLCVQRTGWGKSLVYSLATRLLREQGAGPTLLISPLLSLMRNQVAMASRIGIQAARVDSTNVAEWNQIAAQASEGKYDVLLVSPERLSSDSFLRRFLPIIGGRLGLLVVDEVHCISDWGHDFRPDYRRISRILRLLPPQVPVLGTTATASSRVIEDIKVQLGHEIVVQRGPLVRSSLRLQNILMPDVANRLAWISQNVARLPGSGIIYCLTVVDAELVATWLKSEGIMAEAYHSGLSPERREFLEDCLISNRVKALVATVALGMGFDKPDLGFVIHFQRPASVVAYYQQVGRAGRAIDRAYGILLSGDADDEVHHHFLSTAFPAADDMRRILGILEEANELTEAHILSQLNLAKPTVERALKLLSIDGAVGQEGNRWFRTPNQWEPDDERIERVTQVRRTELQQIRDYVMHSGCLMQYLASALDDPTAVPCNRCANCLHRGFGAAVADLKVVSARKFLVTRLLNIEPQKEWPAGTFKPAPAGIPSNQRAEHGRVLCRYGDAGWGTAVRKQKFGFGRFDDALVGAAAEAIREWAPQPSPTWLAAIPSNRRPNLVTDFAERLAQRLGIPFFQVLEKVRDTPEQKTMHNSTHQVRNVVDAFRVSQRCPNGPVLLVDDIVDSGWTFTVAASVLRQNGSGPVFPFALAKATPRRS
jgi:ATP-dependent DNA helicase RecQ